MEQRSLGRVRDMGQRSDGLAAAAPGGEPFDTLGGVLG